MTVAKLTLKTLAFALAAHPVLAQDERPRFGGPDSVEQVIEEDRTRRGGFMETEVLDPFKDWQSGLEEDHGFSFGADYSALTVHASDVLDGTDDRFGIDRTNPMYKETGAMKSLLEEQTKRRKKNRIIV